MAGSTHARRQFIGLTADDNTAVLTMLVTTSQPATNELVAYDLADGTQRWHLVVPVAEHVFPASSSDGVTTYTAGSMTAGHEPHSAVTATDVTTAYDTATGTELWAMHTNGPRPHTAAVFGDGNVYVSADDALVAIDGRTGRQRWRHPTTSPVVLAAADGVVLITPSGSAKPGDSQLLAARDGALRWHRPLANGVAATSVDAIFVTDGGAAGHCGD